MVLDESFVEMQAANPKSASPVLLNEILTQILSYLPYNLVIQLRALSKATKDLITNNNTLWKNLTIQKCLSTPYLQKINVEEANTQNWPWYKFFRTRLFPIIRSEKELVQNMHTSQTDDSHNHNEVLPTREQFRIGMFLDLKRVNPSSVPVNFLEFFRKIS